jgi:hypothetical protein
VGNQSKIDEEIKAAREELASLDFRRKELQHKLQRLEISRQSLIEKPLLDSCDTSQTAKIALFRSLFRGRVE